MNPERREGEKRDHDSTGRRRVASHSPKTNTRTSVLSTMRFIGVERDMFSIRVIIYDEGESVS
jgi:hypothetical protein